MTFSNDSIMETQLEPINCLFNSAVFRTIDFWQHFLFQNWQKIKILNAFFYSKRFDIVVETDKSFDHEKFLNIKLAHLGKKFE